MPKPILRDEDGVRPEDFEMVEDYSSTGARRIDVPLQIPLSVPREYSWVSEALRAIQSKHKAGSDMAKFSRKISGRSRQIWNVEGTAFQQEVLVRAFKEACLHLERPVSANLFLHLFEVNRRHEPKSGDR